jgi:hypothetical protein
MQFFLLVVVPVLGAVLTFRSGNGGVSVFMIVAAVLNLLFVVGRDDSRSSSGAGCHTEWDARGNPLVCD